jgi:hypothetical protein
MLDQGELAHPRIGFPAYAPHTLSFSLLATFDARSRWIASLTVSSLMSFFIYAPDFFAETLCAMHFQHTCSFAAQHCYRRLQWMWFD